MRPYRWQPTRLPRPWDSPGKNTGVGCHFLLQCRKVKSESEVAQSCLTLSDPMDCSPPSSSVHGIFPGKSTGVGCHCLLRTKTLRLFRLFLTNFLNRNSILYFQNLIFLILHYTIPYGEGNSTPLQYSCLENAMDGGAW